MLKKKLYNIHQIIGIKIFFLVYKIFLKLFSVLLILSLENVKYQKDE